MKEVVGLFEGVGGAEDGFFSEAGTDQLQSDGQIGFCETAGEGDGSIACEIGRDGENVGEVHFERVLGAFA